MSAAPREFAVVAEIGEPYIAALEAPGDEIFDGRAAKLLAEDDDERFLGEDGFAEFGLGVLDVVGFENCGELACSQSSGSRLASWPGARA